jgi:hypothetical protein
MPSGSSRRPAADGGIAAAVLDVDLDGVPVTPVADVLAAIRVPFLYATGLLAGGNAFAPSSGAGGGEALRSSCAGSCRSRPRGRGQDAARPAT